ncbi:MAG: alginate export family protein [Polaribacter sp.]|nr:alginate export family protein [Polaribacter sp.]
MKKIGILTVIASLFTSAFFAQQFEMSAEIRPRFENKHGYKTLLLSNAEGSNFVSQRTRLNLHFNSEKLAIGLSYQNVRVWGDVSTLSANDNAFALHEAWAETRISDHFSVRLGRQEIVYDDSRIFGNLGWAQQARSHDALLAKFTWNNNKLDIGLALNADNQSEIATLYSNVAGYKAFQYAWYHTNINNVNLSLLAVNNGVEFLNTHLEKEVNYSQTLGGRLTTKRGGFNVDGAAYIQTGKLNGNTVSASYFAGNISYKTSEKITLGVGAEYLSGKDMNATSTTIKSFAPLYGTNHKFNGWMDYFYVGNHKNSVGMIDINATFAYKKGKFSAKVIPHLFSAAADVYDGTTKMDSNLGTEIDVNLGYTISSNSSVNIGYSKLFATNAMEVLKGGDKDENNSWAWVMFTFKPTLFSSK